MNPTWTSDCGTVKLWLADCLEVLPTLMGIRAIVTDPPYGINADRTRNSEQWGWTDYPAGGWDKERPPRECFDAMLARGVPTVVWGGNYFTDYLPQGDKWLIWDKGQTDFSLADCEVAWCSFSGAIRRLMLPRSAALKDGKCHPTQKPIALMEWCLLQLPKGKGAIVDCFLGSGTTGVACARAGLPFFGVEKDAHHFGNAQRRISDELIKKTGNYKADPKKYPLLALGDE